MRALFCPFAVLLLGALVCPSRAEIVIPIPELIGYFDEDVRLSLDIDVPVPAASFTLVLQGPFSNGVYRECGTYDYEFRGADVYIDMWNVDAPDESRCISSTNLPWSPSAWSFLPRFKESVAGVSRRTVFQGTQVHANIFLGDRYGLACGGFDGMSNPWFEITVAEIRIDELVPVEVDRWGRVKALYAR